MPPYERFMAWRHSHELALAVYRVTARFPADERFGLVSQARRAAFSAAGCQLAPTDSVLAALGRSA